MEMSANECRAMLQDSAVAQNVYLGRSSASWPMAGDNINFCNRVLLCWRQLLDGNDHDGVFFLIVCSRSAGGRVTLRFECAAVQAGILSRALALFEFDHVLARSGILILFPSLLERG